MPLLDRCPHQGGSLCAGVLTGYVSSTEPGEYVYSRPGEFIRCPGTAGTSMFAPASRGGEPERVYTKPYAVEVAAGRELVEGPYQAETFDVSIEQSYVVIED